jgi:hypothetical protein
MPKIIFVEFFCVSLEKLPLYEETHHDKSYLDILNSNQNINDLRFVIFLIVHSYVVYAGDANITVHSLVHKESKCVRIFFRLSLIVYEIKAFYCYILNSAQQQCNDLTWKIQSF